MSAPRLAAAGSIARILIRERLGYHLAIIGIEHIDDGATLSEIGDAWVTLRLRVPAADIDEVIASPNAEVPR